MRLRGRLDTNHRDIVKALEKAGATVQSLADLGEGCPDILVGFRGVNKLFEIKDGSLPPSRRMLTEQEAIWHNRWRGKVYVVTNIEEAWKALLL